MADKKSYTPVAEFADLKRVELALKEAKTADEVRKICITDGPKIGYKAFCYLLTGKMTAEQMKPEEANKT
jgi:hypothetical protein